MNSVIELNKQIMLTVILIAGMGFSPFHSSYAAQNNPQSRPKTVSSKQQEAISYYNKAVKLHLDNQYDIAEINYRKAIELNPSFNEAKLNLANIYFTKANQHSKKNDFAQAVLYMNKGIALNPKAISAKHNLAVIYYNKGVTDFDSENFEGALKSYDKVTEIEPDFTEAYFAKGNAYLKLNQYDSALGCYKKVLELNPNHAGAKNNIEYTLQQKDEYTVNKNLNEFRITERAPSQLYNLVKADTRVDNSAINGLYTMLDLIWSDTEGKKLLNTVINNKIPINITPSMTRANAKVEEKKYNLMVYGLIPITVYKDKNISINISQDYIREFKDSNLSYRERIHSLQVIIHEVCHAAKSTLSKTKDSLSEEMGASIIGYDISYRVLTGNSMTEKQIEDYSKSVLKALLTDSHRYLDVYNDFGEQMQRIGVIQPYSYKYASIPNVYSQIRKDRDTQRLDTLERMLNN